MPKIEADEAIATFREAARQNMEEPGRDGSIFRLPGYGQAVMTGDLHGHKKNFEKLTRYAMLDRVNARHVILHEMVHTDRPPGQPDHSHELLLMAAIYKCHHPEQVHFLQSNHEMAQLTGYPIAKNGRAVVEDYNDAVEACYGSSGTEVLAAMREFIRSFPIAILTENGVWMSHSLPNAAETEAVDWNIFKRPLVDEDFKDHGFIFQLVWGRRHTSEQLEALSKKLGVQVFIIGHQPQEAGYTLQHDRLIILASDHNHGTFLPFDLSKPSSAGEMIKNIRKFVAVE
jgi:hypothetical protein